MPPSAGERRRLGALMRAPAPPVCRRQDQRIATQRLEAQRRRLPLGGEQVSCVVKRKRTFADRHGGRVDQRDAILGLQAGWREPRPLQRIGGVEDLPLELRTCPRRSGMRAMADSMTRSPAPIEPVDGICG